MSCVVLGVLLQSTYFSPEYRLRPGGKTSRVEIDGKDISFISVPKTFQALKPWFSWGWDCGKIFMILSLYRSKSEDFKDFVNVFAFILCVQ